MIFGKYINKYYLKYSLLLLLGIISLVLVDYFQLEIPELYRLVVNGMNNGYVSVDGQKVAFDMHFLLENICRPFITVILVMVAGRFLWRICFFGSGILVETDIRKRMFDHCRTLSQQFYQVHKVGTMMSLFTNDLETVQDCFGTGVLMFFDALLLGGLAIFKMWQMHGWLTFFALIPMGLLLSIGTVVGKYMMKKWEHRQEMFSELSDFSQESFSGIAVIKAFVKETKELLAFRWLNRKNEDANVSYTKASTLLNVLVVLFVESVNCILLGYGGYLVHIRTFDAGQLIEFIGYFSAIVWPIMAISQLIEMQSRGKASLKRISELLDAKPDVVDRKNAEAVGTLTGKITFRDLTFCYPGEQLAALNHVSFTIEAGENVGIIGKTGAGKTTLVDLILRTYNVPDGTLFVDEYDVNDVTIHSVRENIAYVPQDNFLFSDTIANNIAFATTGKQGVEEAAKLSDIHENIVEFQEGYDTLLGERGVNVSGGQKQRISIARALMKQAPILILDDAVSAVDTGTEKVILDNLRKTRAGKTTIFIAHRISTVEQMDKIIFIEDGQVIAVGTHTMLCEQCLAYKKMVDLQKLEEEKAGDANV